MKSPDPKHVTRVKRLWAKIGKAMALPDSNPRKEEIVEYHREHLNAFLDDFKGSYAVRLFLMGVIHYFNSDD